MIFREQKGVLNICLDNTLTFTKSIQRSQGVVLEHASAQNNKKDTQAYLEQSIK